MVEEKDVPFALRLPAKVKEAAAALIPLGSIFKISETGQRDVMAHTGSINEALNGAIIEGLRAILKELRSGEVTLAQFRFNQYRELMEFLIKTPSARHVTSGDLKAGSMGQMLVETKAKEWTEFEGPFPSFPGMSRVEVANGYASNQERMEQLTAAEFAVTQALESHNPRKKIAPEHMRGDDETISFIVTTKQKG